MTYLTRGGRDWRPDYLMTIDPDVCIGCGRCYKVCGRDVMTLKGMHEDGEVVDDDEYDDEIVKRVMAMNDPDACIGCGACARVCPTNCQTHAKAA